MSHDDHCDCVADLERDLTAARDALIREGMARDAARTRVAELEGRDAELRWRVERDENERLRAELLRLQARLGASPQAVRPRFVDPGRGPRQAVAASPQAAPPRHECPSCDLDDSVKVPPGKLLASTPIKRAATPVQGAPPDEPGSLWTTPANPGAAGIKVDESVTAADVRAAVESVQGRVAVFSGARCEAWMAKGRCEFKPGHTGAHETRCGSYSWTTPGTAQAAPADGPTCDPRCGFIDDDVRLSPPYMATPFWRRNKVYCSRACAKAARPLRPVPAVPEPVREPNLGLAPSHGASPLPKKEKKT